MEYYGGKNEVNGGEGDSGAAQCTFLQLLLCVHLPLRVFFSQQNKKQQRRWTVTSAENFKLL